MKDRILELSQYAAPSGAEAGISQALLRHVEDVADEVRIDRLGNAIAIKHGRSPRVMLAAHADEPGVMVTHIDDQGFVRLVSVGDLDARSLVGRHVQFTNGVVGIVGVESEVKPADITFDHLYVDIGAESAEAAHGRVRIGLEGVIDERVVVLDDNRLVGRALDNRVGCSIAIETFRTLAAEGYAMSVVFTAQQAVGARGARTAAFQLKPDLAFVIDAAPAGDMPQAPRMALKLGAGPAVKVMDRTVIVPLNIKDLLMDSAKAAGVDIQYEVWPLGLTDAGAIQVSEAGIALGGVSYPARYVGGPSTMVDLRDAAGAVQLLCAAVRRAAGQA
ncbi:peptidase M42 [Alicyclobacillus cycloheptanicus]|uniref:Endoglucanase n=1 Tax=Alicyclobacillus cycloheptanicus TaxID=1457 RepID=A0ABT9XEH9_9BACL|nr:peptidase M42 [Alicyclobacillus cycloheptanicus]MDQ0188540.1 endoglucanase [Alicyclobacillus cycloheptanicus]WDM01225.1 peptidase M42 [Alicyclobacillus cycloheptanicus]